MEKNALDYIAEKLTESLSEKGFLFSRDDNNFFCENDDLQYTVEYVADKKKVTLKVRQKSEDSSSDDWRSVSSWMLDMSSASNKDIDMICDDFVETISGPKKREVRPVIKRTNSDEKNVGSLFFANRMANMFPELKQKIYIEKECYSEFRGVKFTREYIVPEILSLLDDGKDKKKIEKLFTVLSDLYDNGNLDVRGIISMVVLNSIEGESKISMSKKYMSKELVSAWESAQKFKGKKVKPEKPKKVSKFMSDTLSSK